MELSWGFWRFWCYDPHEPQFHKEPCPTWLPLLATQHHGIHSSFHPVLLLSPPRRVLWVLSGVAKCH